MKIANALGITTKTFMKAAKQGLIHYEEVIRWAAIHGIGWVELRDDKLTFTADELSRVDQLAREIGIKIHYAWDGSDLLAEDDEDKFREGVKRAVMFGPDVCCRITISTSVFRGNAAKKGYTREEFEKLCGVIQKYEAIASEHNVEIAYENAFEPVKGDGSAYYGMEELMTACPTMKATFDPGNFLNAGQVRALPTWDDVKHFFTRYRDRIHYIHLKCTKDHVLVPTLIDDGDIDLDFMLENISERDLLCIELPGQDSVEQCKANIEAAVALIRAKANSL